MKQLPVLALRMCPCMGMSLCNLHVPSGFGGRAGSQLSMGRIILLGVLASITLEKGRAGNGRAKARAKCELGLLL